MFFDVKVYFHLILSWYYPYEFVFCPFIYNENKLCLENIFNFFPQKIFSFFLEHFFVQVPLGKCLGRKGVLASGGRRWEKGRGRGALGREGRGRGRVGLDLEEGKGKGEKGGKGRREGGGKKGLEGDKSGFVWSNEN